MYIIFEIHIFVPPPLHLYFFSPSEIYDNKGVSAAGEKVQLFLWTFVYFNFLSQLGKKYEYFLTDGGKYAVTRVTPHFSTPFNHIIPQLIIDPPPRRGGGGQT